MSDRLSKWLAAILLLVAALTPGRASQAEPLLVFAAASTREAVEAVLALADRRLGLAPVASFASSGTLARQIDAGAPAHIYLSANVGWMDHLQRTGRIAAESRADLVGNRLVLVAPAQRDRPADRGIPELRPDDPLVAGLSPGRLAIGDPRSVPAGQYARQALRALGLWKRLADRLAPAPDVRAALALVERGATPLGIVYRTDALAATGVRVVATVPARTHDPILYPIALTDHGSGSAEAHDLLQLFLSPDGRAAFAERGFTTLD